ncbi:transposase [Ectothiorhodospira shaposhnikovii]|uniref:transposase n=1 Tax=Ectothiorhodospira shaposhnikovii TaxID=1054 RepID=UPI001EE84F0E|nr:transposase [Ectothiorhodospira shaposhnikovii]MCG5513281.1 transposase [Ectothiorhodospira shaposhnikovii]
MTRPRSELVSVTDTPWYHVVSRCVRRAFLCGQDHHTGQNFEHRRGWIEARIRQLAAVFAIDVAAYAVMSNHYHIVLRIDQGRAQGWSDEAVLRRWTSVFSGPPVVQRYLDPQARDTLHDAELAQVREWVGIYRSRLVDLSWFMRVLNETIARKANAEDGVRGRFWEGRFKSQALLDEQAILSAMAYVDLNPIRAGIADTPETSEHTSLEARLCPDKAEARMRAALAKHSVQGDEARVSGEAGTDIPHWRDALRCEHRLAPLAVAPLMPFDATGREPWAVPFAWADYLALVEVLGRCVHPAKRGFMPAQTPKLLDRLGMDAEAFIAHGTSLLQAFGHAVGKPAKLVEHAACRQAKFLRGMGAARRVFERRAVM